MNSSDQIREALVHFLDKPEAGVLAVKGKWGVGKTYLWNAFLKEYKIQARKKAYSYVSLFGIQNVAELRHAIFAKHESLSDSKGQKALGKGKAFVSKNAKHFKLGPLKNTELFADLVQEYFLKDFIVCIDDLERMEKSLSPTSLLGYITSLREGSGWNSSDLKLLLPKSSQDFFDWMESDNDKNLLRRIRSLRSKIGGIENSQAILDRLDEALHKIAKRSQLNEMRVYQTIELDRPKGASQENSDNHNN